MHIRALLTIALLCKIWQGNTSIVRSQNLLQNPHKIGRNRVRRAAVVHSCSSKIYCQGDLLDVVQRARLFNDSKTFVDMSQKNDEQVTLENFKKMMQATSNNPSKADVQKFVNENFELEAESEPWIPPDYNPTPRFLDTVTDPSIKEFAKTLIGIWPVLGRRIISTVKENSNRYSLIPVPEPFIVPGGRFREIYYWDSYWIIKGLLISQMNETVKGMLNNFIYFIKKYGLIPNGSRLYYLNRSQPPVFTAMVGLYVDYTNDINWLRENIHYIEAEMDFWLTKRTLTITKLGTNFELAHYGTDSNTPRPESYMEDVETCSYAKPEVEQHACYNALKSGAETGWDFSSRFIFDEQGGTNANLSRTDSGRVIPTDLNAFLCKSFRLLSRFYGQLGNASKEIQWTNQADKWQRNMQTLMYNKADGIWYDYDYEMNQQRKYFFPSNFAPLWAECYDLNNANEVGSKAAKYFQSKEIHQFLGGIPTSLENTGEQWDFPNAWPPLQEIVILGLYKTRNKEAQGMARELANRWVTANMIGHEKSGEMFEKYDAEIPGQYGGGGEYAVQVGFGWSNGVVLSFIEYFNSTGSFSASSSGNAAEPTLSNLTVYVIICIYFIGKLLSEFPIFSE